MELSIFLAKVLGITYTLIGLIFIIKHDYYRHFYEKIIKDDVYMLTGGIIGILLGSALIISHNIWVWNWPVIITIIGWGGLIKGINLLLFPVKGTRYFSKWFKNKQFIIFGGTFWLIFGLVLAYFGFTA